MFALIRAFSVRELLMQQAPVVAVSLLVAEMFYKFHSFILETAAFLGTWFVLDAGIQTAKRLLARNSRASGGR